MTNPITNDEHHLWRLLNRIGVLIDKYEAEIFTKTPITKAQFKILVTMALISETKKSTIILTDLIPSFDTTLVSISSIIDRMEKNGLVKKSKNLPDKRTVRVVMTPKGKKILGDTIKVNNQIIKDIFTVLTEDELKSFIGLASKVKNRIDDLYFGRLISESDVIKSDITTQVLNTLGDKD